MDRPRIVGVLAEDAGAWLSEVRPWIEAAVNRDGLMDFDDVRGAILNREMQLWLIMRDSAVEGVCVTEISAYPKKRVLAAVVVGGARMARWIGPLDFHLTRYALANDCDRFMAPIARRGWRPFAKALGWSERATYWKDLAE